MLNKALTTKLVILHFSEKVTSNIIFVIYYQEFIIVETIINY